MSIIFLCEDNGIAISVRTLGGWIEVNFANRPALYYIPCDGADLNDALRRCEEAVTYARSRRRPVFLHIRTVRLMGHAGADVEASYAPLAKWRKRVRCFTRLLLKLQILHHPRLLRA